MHPPQRRDVIRKARALGLWVRTAAHGMISDHRSAISQTVPLKYSDYSVPQLKMLRAFLVETILGTQIIR